MWLLKYSDQRVVLPSGRPREIKVIGGEETFQTYAAATHRLVVLRRDWPGLRAEIRPVLMRDARKVVTP
jgi:hypothetical protein